MDITKEDLLTMKCVDLAQRSDFDGTKCTDSTDWAKWNDLLIRQINELGFMQISADIRLLDFLTYLILSFVLALLIDSFIKSIKEIHHKKGDIIEEINSCTRHYLEKCLENDQFRKLLINTTATVLIIFSLIGLFLGSSMFGFVMGIVVLALCLYDLQKKHIT